MVSKISDAVLGAYEREMESEEGQQSVARLRELYKRQVKEPAKVVRRRSSRKWEPPKIKRESSSVGVSRSSSTVGRASSAATPAKAKSPEKKSPGKGASSIQVGIVNVTQERVPVRLVRVPFDKEREVAKYRGMLGTPVWFNAECTKDSVALQEQLVGEAVSAMQTLFPVELDAYYQSTVLTDGGRAESPDHEWYVAHFLERIDQVLGPRNGGMDTVYMGSIPSDKHPKFRAQWMSISVQNQLEPFLRHIGVIPRSVSIGEQVTGFEINLDGKTAEKGSLADSWLQMVNATTLQTRERLKRKRDEKDDSPKGKRFKAEEPQPEPATPQGDWRARRDARRERMSRFKGK